ncbi:MAG: TIGR01212 family radical SAM protein [Fusobacteriaceae bacterium]
MSSRYYTINDFFKENFSEKIYKVSLDAGLSCPNRDGKISLGGCIFCSDSGSGEFTSNKKNSITKQINEQLIFIEKKAKKGKVIAYFQNFTNTYGDIEYLKKVFLEALSHERVIGIAIATRPDCLDNPVLELLSEINENYFLWIELGLQSSDDSVAKYINRGYTFSTYLAATKNLKLRNIKFVTHIIVGLPKALKNDSLITAREAVKAGSWGIKIHLLYVIKNTYLEKLLLEKEFELLTMNEYIQICIDIIRNIPKDLVIHRLTGDGEKSALVGPLWSLNKLNVLNNIEKELKKNNYYQGELLDENLEKRK